jgi:CO/xanthine dehydrogenase FAD-binding subunit
MNKRAVSIDAFLASRHKLSGIVTAVRFDKIPINEFYFVKVTRTKPKGTSVVTIAVRATTKRDGTVSSARIALGCLAGKPMRAKKAELALIGSKLTEQGIASAVEAITDGISPITDPAASGWYRREVLPVHFRRLLLGKSET